MASLLHVPPSSGISVRGGSDRGEIDRQYRNGCGRVLAVGVFTSLVRKVLKHASVHVPSSRPLSLLGGSLRIILAPLIRYLLDGKSPSNRPHPDQRPSHPVLEIPSPRCSQSLQFQPSQPPKSAHHLPPSNYPHGERLPPSLKISPRLAVTTKTTFLAELGWKVDHRDMNASMLVVSPSVRSIGPLRREERRKWEGYVACSRWGICTSGWRM